MTPRGPGLDSGYVMSHSRITTGVVVIFALLMSIGVKQPIDDGV